MTILPHYLSRNDVEPTVPASFKSAYRTPEWETRISDGLPF